VLRHLSTGRLGLGWQKILLCVSVDQVSNSTSAYFLRAMIFLFLVHLSGMKTDLAAEKLSDSMELNCFLIFEIGLLI
jgi:hypothetical protein